METSSKKYPVNSVKPQTDDAVGNTEPSRETEGVTTIPKGSTHKRVEVRGTQTGNAVG